MKTRKRKKVIRPKRVRKFHDDDEQEQEDASVDAIDCGSEKDEGGIQS